MSDKPKIMIQATIGADRNKVWDMYTQPDHIIHWNFASDDWCCPQATNDLRMGGKYVARMEAKDGSFGFDFEATYMEINQGEHISYTIADGRHVTVAFRSHDDHTHVHITFEAEQMNPLEMQQEGWQAILNNFKKYVEGS